MNDSIQAIAERLRGLREVLELSVAEVSTLCNMTETDYLACESGNTDISVSMLQRIAKKYNVELSAIMFGEEPKMSSYFLTRAGMGTTIERTKAYKYQSLAAGFKSRKADPFIVTVEPKEESLPFTLNTHLGQEFNLVLEGDMVLNINGKELILHEGDSLYFDGEQPHGMKALNNQTVKFLAVIL